MASNTHPNGYWTDELIISTWKNLVKEHGECAKSLSWVRKNGPLGLSRAISRSGGVRKFNSLIGWKMLRSNWTDELIFSTWKGIVDEHGECAKSVRWLSKNGFSGLRRAICMYGGSDKFKSILGWRKLKTVWTDDLIIATWKQLIAENGEIAFSRHWLGSYGHGALSRAVGLRGGIDVFAERMGFHATGGAAIALRPALANLTKLIEGLGDQIDNLDQKSWLLILEQSKALDHFNKGNLAPVKLQMLSGEFKPSDFKPTSEVDEHGHDVPPPALQALIDAANKIETEEATVAADDYEIVDESEEEVRRLATLRPAQILKGSEVAAAVITDEQALSELLLHRTESIWHALFRALPEHRNAMVAEMLQEPVTNAFVAESLRLFESEWTAIQQLILDGIPGIVKPVGGDLNLMQQREAALLRRDGARFNFSDMGAGKTLSAIAGMQLAGAQRVLVLCPNNTIPSWETQLKSFLPSAFTAQKTWAPFFGIDQRPQWTINNLEMLQDRYRDGISQFIGSYRPEAIEIDEVHLCKGTDADNPSQRRALLGEMMDWARANDVLIYAMSGTPVVNKLTEAIDLIRMIRPEIANGLNPRHTSVNVLKVHNALQPFTTRFVPLPPAQRINRRIDVRADHLYQDLLDGGSNATTMDANLSEAKIDALVELAKKPGKLLVFTTPVTNVVDPVIEALSAAGITAVRHTGEEKFLGTEPTVELFKSNPDVKVLVASTSTLSTGVDGLQHVCGRCVFLTLPWTPAEYSQAVARLLRQGTAFDEIEITTICASLNDPKTGEDWSLDDQKLAVLDGKRTVLDGVLDGSFPTKDALVFSKERVAKAQRSWLTRSAS